MEDKETGTLLVKENLACNITADEYFKFYCNDEIAKEFYYKIRSKLEEKEGEC